MPTTQKIRVHVNDPHEGGVHYDPASVSLSMLDARIERLSSWPLDIRDAYYHDPRCGCEEDGEGAKCDWDDVNVLEHEIAVRLAAAA